MKYVRAVDAIVRRAYSGDMTTESTVAIAQPSLDDDFAALDYWNAVRDDAEREALKSGLVSLTDGVPTVHAQR